MCELVGELGDGLPHLDGCAHCAEGVVLVQAREAEDRGDRVADVLLDDASVALDRRGGGLGVARQDPMHRLGVESLRQASRVDEIREQEAHRPADAVGRPGRRGRLRRLRRCDRRCDRRCEPREVELGVVREDQPLEPLELLARLQTQLVGQ